MKRFGEKKVREILNNGGFIIYHEYFTLNAGYKVHTDVNGDPVGYITFDLWLKLLRDETIASVLKRYESEVYALNH